MTKKKGRLPGWETDVVTPLPEMPGIYIIWFDGNTRAYIGCSKNIQKRVRYHLSAMQNYHSNKMFADLKRFGSGAVRAAVLEIVDDFSRIPMAETYWINRYLSGGWKLYNAELKGKGHRDRGGQ